MAADESPHRERQRWCVWAMYGGPVLLALIAVPAMFLVRHWIVSQGFTLYLPAWMLLISLVNATMAGLVAALGGVYRRGSMASRVASGLLFGIAGAALYVVSFFVVSGVFLSFLTAR